MYIPKNNDFSYQNTGQTDSRCIYIYIRPERWQCLEQLRTCSKSLYMLQYNGVVWGHLLQYVTCPKDVSHGTVKGGGSRAGSWSPSFPTGRTRKTSQGPKAQLGERNMDLFTEEILKHSFGTILWILSMKAESHGTTQVQQMSTLVLSTNKLPFCSTAVHDRDGISRRRHHGI